MQKISIFNYKGTPIKAELVLAFTCSETGKQYVAINNGDLVFSNDSSYNNLDILEITNEANQEYFVSDIPENEWSAVQNTLIKEVFSKIKSN